VEETVWRRQASQSGGDSEEETGLTENTMANEKQVFTPKNNAISTLSSSCLTRNKHKLSSDQSQRPLLLFFENNPHNPRVPALGSLHKP
jgi:transposase-like protein